LLNQVLLSIHHKVDACHAKQQGLLLDHIISIITDPGNDMSGELISGSMHDLNERICKWADVKCTDIQNFAQLHLTNEACENTIDLWAMEAVIHRIAAHRKELDLQTEACFNAEGIEKHCLSRLAELEAQVAECIAVEDTHLSEMVTAHIGALRHEAKIKLLDAKDDLSSHPLTMAIRSEKLVKPSLISSRTCLKGKAKKKCNALDLNSQPLAEDSDTPMTTDNDGLVSRSTPASPAFSGTGGDSSTELTP
jgi:hypothetical protein